MGFVVHHPAIKNSIFGLKLDFISLPLPTEKCAEGAERKEGNIYDEIQTKSQNISVLSSNR